MNSTPLTKSELTALFAVLDNSEEARRNFSNLFAFASTLTPEVAMHVRNHCQHNGIQLNPAPAQSGVAQD